MLDAYVDNLGYKGIIDFVKNYSPDWIVISTAPSILYWRCPPLDVTVPGKVIRELKKHTYCKMIVIGPHATISPQWTLHETGADFVFAGSPEMELAKYIIEYEMSGSQNPDRVLMQTQTIDVTKDIKADISAFDLSKPYIPHMWSVAKETLPESIQPAILLETSRGCPYSCFYCFKAPLRNHFQRRNIEYVKYEINEAVERGVKYIYFIDEIFNLPHDNYDCLLSFLAKIPVQFGCQARPDLISTDSAKKLKEAGCIYIEFGVDSYDNLTSDSVNRKQDSEKAWDGIKITKELIPIVRYNRLNFKTMDYMALLNLTEGLTDWSFPPDPVYPYPNTLIGDAVMKKYGYHTYSWSFAEKYSQWLRIEVALQRKHRMNDRLINLYKHLFLSLPGWCERVLCRFLDPIKFNKEFEKANLYVMKEGCKYEV